MMPPKALAGHRGRMCRHKSTYKFDGHPSPIVHHRNYSAAGGPKKHAGPGDGFAAISAFIVSCLLWRVVRGRSPPLHLQLPLKPGIQIRMSVAWREVSY